MNKKSKIEKHSKCGNFVSGQMECTHYVLQSNQYKRSSGYQMTGTDVAISDNFLFEGWYRFQSGAGNDMVTSAPPIAMCGTLYPVWLDGKVIVDIYNICLYLIQCTTLNMSLYYF